MAYSKLKPGTRGLLRAFRSMNLLTDLSKNKTANRKQDRKAQASHYRGIRFFKGSKHAKETRLKVAAYHRKRTSVKNVI